MRLHWAGRGRRVPDPPTAFTVVLDESDDRGGRNRLFHGDNLAVMSALARDPRVRGGVAMAYMDPPFNTGGAFHVGGRHGGRGASDVPAFDDSLTPADYLGFMEARLHALVPLMAKGGSVFLHADARAIHYLKVLMDEVFGARRFINEIIWHYRSGGVARGRYPAKHDTILWYAVDGAAAFYPDDVAVERSADNHMRRTITADGRPARSIRSNGVTYTYPDDEGVCPPDVWTDISHLHQRHPERTGYATQKPEALLERLLRGSSRAGDLVFDPFCGSGTTLAVAARLGRRWIGADASAAAVEICARRLQTAPRNRETEPKA